MVIQVRSFTGFRYKCQRCTNYQLCQQCFWRGRTSSTHSNEHEMKEYSTYVSLFLCIPRKIIKINIFSFFCARCGALWKVILFNFKKKWKYGKTNICIYSKFLCFYRKFLSKFLCFSNQKFSLKIRIVLFLLYIIQHQIGFNRLFFAENCFFHRGN